MTETVVHTPTLQERLTNLKVILEKKLQDTRDLYMSNGLWNNQVQSDSI